MFDLVGNGEWLRFDPLKFSKVQTGYWQLLAATQDIKAIKMKYLSAFTASNQV